jgi:hypothetical protein
MARIRKEQALNWLAEKIDTLNEGECLDFLCKKRNRIVRIIKDKDSFLIEERGFFKEDFKVDRKDLFKLVERLFSREFPRSFMLWAHKRKAF